LDPETIGKLSGLLVIISIVPYAIRVWQRKIHPVPTSWFLWSLIGLAILLTFKSSGAENNVWPAVFSFTNPILIVIISSWRGNKWERPSFLEMICLGIGIVSLIMWIFIHNNRGLATLALCLAVTADACGALPTIKSLLRRPERDRPFSWMLFAFAYFLSIFSITENTFANYILPIYMTLGSLSIGSILCIYRLKKKISIREWI